MYNPKILNNKKEIKNKKKYIYENDFDLLKQNPNQNLSNNDRILNNYNQKLFMTEEIKENYGEIITNQEQMDLINIDDDNIDTKKNNITITEPHKLNHYNSEYYLNDNRMKNKNILNNMENSMDSNNYNSSLNNSNLVNNEKINFLI